MMMRVTVTVVGVLQARISGPAGGGEPESSEMSVHSKLTLTSERLTFLHLCKEVIKVSVNKKFLETTDGWIFGIIETCL